MGMREEFEAWYLTEYFEGDKDCGLEWLSTEPCGSYRYERPSTQWKIWQASRAALVIELPHSWETYCGTTEEFVMYADDVRDVIRAAGVSYKWMS
jgi:hypothetical protein